MYRLIISVIRKNMYVSKAGFSKNPCEFPPVFSVRKFLKGSR